MPEQPEDRTPSATLMSVMEDFGNSEPRTVLVLWEDEDGHLAWRVSSPHMVTDLIGMLDCVRAEFMKRFLNAPATEL